MNLIAKEVEETFTSAIRNRLSPIKNLIFILEDYPEKLTPEMIELADKQLIMIEALLDAQYIELEKILKF